MARNVILAASFRATADRLSDMYLDPQAHAAFTRAPVTIEPRPGTPFRAFEECLPAQCSTSSRSGLLSKPGDLPTGPLKPWM